ncbi:MAG: hypothetical protein WAZ18_05865 [Alphaproteobacteria bacterium]
MDAVLAFKGGSPSRWGHYAYSALAQEINKLDDDMYRSLNIGGQAISFMVIGSEKIRGEDGYLVDYDGLLETPIGNIKRSSGQELRRGFLELADLDKSISQASTVLIRNEMDYLRFIQPNESPILFKKPGSFKPESILLPKNESFMAIVALDRLMQVHPDMFLKPCSKEEIIYALRENTPPIALATFSGNNKDVCRAFLQSKILKGLGFSCSVYVEKAGYTSPCDILADYQNVQRVLRVMKQVCPDLFVKNFPSSIEPTQTATAVAVVGDEVLPQVVQPVVVDIIPELESNKGEVERVEAVDVEPHIPLNQRKKHQRGTVDTRWDEVDPNKIADEVLSLFFTVQYYDGVPPELPEVRRVGLGTPRAAGGSTSLSNGARSSSIRPRNEVGGTVAVMRKIDFDYTVNRVRHAARWIRKIEGRPTGHKLPHRTQLEMKNWHHVAGYVLQARAVDVTFPLRQDQDGNTLVLTAFPSPWMEILPNIDAAADFATPKDPLFLQGEVLHDEDYEPAK